MDRLEELSAIEEIKQCKARYWRAIDSKNFDLLETVFAPECLFDTSQVAYDPVKGQHPLIPAKREPSRSCQEIIANAKRLMGDNVQSAHMGHIPEVEILSPTAARAIFPFEDRVLNHGIAAFDGYGYYQDTFERIKGQWLVKSSVIHRYRVIFDTVE
ncbi:nuclear transport factor 2 family protein [Hutsoniella sourekii]|uniref:nuclear transport factor 2 family protein n=1 Tax=Hutsoniella sourekii TaxID=87650 RepID=UPI0004884055|nr:nuclear transport factor 2 family protein [Hutsoniella sourekii]